MWHNVPSKSALGYDPINETSSWKDYFKEEILNQLNMIKAVAEQ
jgi:hypothetical protein